jgi:hypothetical protein
MPIVAAYRHRLVEDPPYSAEVGFNNNTRYRVGRTYAYVWAYKHAPLRPQILRHLAKEIEAPGVLRPHISTPAWNETVGDYPAGSPYDFPEPFLELCRTR